ncbi:MAG: hypothetical protein C0465_25775 [Ralstonia sp.]|nr:hypothetical protein [Ralstonia sp.]
MISGRATLAGRLCAVCCCARSEGGRMGQMKGKIFINYRREDSAAHALNIAQYLEREFGRHNVFIDVDRMRAGEDFHKVLEQRLQECKVMVAVIGPTWVDVRDEHGARRLDDPKDWVRSEIATALRGGVVVIPVLVGGAELPRQETMPEEVRGLVRRHAAVVTTNGFRHDMAGLTRDIAEVTGRPRRISLSGWVAIVLGVVGLGAAAYWVSVKPPPRPPFEVPLSRPVVKEPAAEPGKPAEEIVDGAAGLSSGSEFRDCRSCPEMVVLAGGTFEIGSPATERGRDKDEQPQVSVAIGAFAIGKNEITREEWLRCVEAGACARKVDPGQVVTARHPASSISWDDASEYVRWLSALTKQRYRLPSEAEWEFAARARSTTPRFWGFDTKAACEYANVGDRTFEASYAEIKLSVDESERRRIELGGVHDCSDGHARLAAVGAFKLNAFGLHDMIGNVWEWVADCAFPSYAALPRDGSRYKEHDCKVLTFRTRA